jgi:glycosyltransferase involved in cell wall biosynthesis
MRSHDYLSIIIPTHSHPFELDLTLLSLSKQKGVDYRRFEVLVINTNSDVEPAFEVARKYCDKMKVRFINILDPKGTSIKNATYGLNIGARKYAGGNLLMLVVDDARVPTPLVLNKTFDAFERWGDDIAVVTWPYHFYKHSSTPGFTVEECREKLKEVRYKRDFYAFNQYAAETNITKSGVHNEATWLGVSMINFLRVGGHNEFFKEWSTYNLDLFRRLTRNPPKDGVQIPKSIGNDHWNKIGIGLKLVTLDGEADFHIHHEMSEAKRNFGVLNRLKREVWQEYARIGNCMIANLDKSWGRGESEEVVL